MSKFKLDKEEFELISKYPTNTQRKYGRPDPRDIYIKYKSIPLKEHLERIHTVKTSVFDVETKNKKPKKIITVKKSSVPFIV